jgi:hypothetical protein
MVLPRFCKAVLDETIDDLGVCLDQLGDVRVLRGLDDLHALLRFFDLHPDLPSVPEQFSEQRITNVNRPDFQYSAVHSRDVLLNLRGNFRFVRFGQGFDAVGSLSHLSADLVVVGKQKVEYVAIHHELRIAAPTAAAAALSEGRPRLSKHLTRRQRNEADNGPRQGLTT